MRNIKCQTEVEIHVSADQLADIFWEMDAEEQTDFFNKLGEKDNLPFQLHHVMSNPHLESQGRWAMSVIGDYAYEEVR